MTGAILRKLWYILMFVCSVGLYVIGVITRDSSVNTFAVLGLLAMLIVPLGNAIGAIYDLRAYRGSVPNVGRGRIHDEAIEKSKSPSK